ncbi:MAG: enolase C-terminal domain-like protein [Rhizobiaceae bacterium]
MRDDLPDERIVGYDVWHCALPVTGERDHGVGLVGGTIEVIILRLQSESGEQGFGEASPWVVFTGSPEASFAALHRYFRPLVVGRKLSETSAILAAARKAVVHCTEAKAALETALLDLSGQILKRPLWSFLGSKCRDRIALSCSIANPDFDADKQLLKRLDEDGVRIVKLKTGFCDLAFDLMRLEYIRKHHPSMALRVDYNQGLNCQEAMKQVLEVEKFQPDFIEQPVAADDWRTMAEIRGRIEVPLLADESVFGPSDMYKAAQEGICDGVSVKIMKSGGLYGAQAVADVAHGAGLSAYGGDMFETGIAHLAGSHMIAATPHITLGCEFYQASYYLLEDLLEEPFPVQDGMVVVSDGPGLGIRPDMKRVGRFAIAEGRA